MKDNNSERFMQTLPDGAKYLIKGVTGTGKTEMLLERYRYLIKELGIQSDSILVLLSDGLKLQSWKEASVFEFSTELKCFTFSGFIHDEINTYYPLITQSSTEIARKDLKPVFLGYDASKFLVSKSVQLRRERNSMFSGLVSTNGKIAVELLGNLSTASECGIPSNEIGARLINSIENKDEAKTAILLEADEVMKAYRRKCLELGAFDAAMCISLYNDYLLENAAYIDMLKKRIRHVIVDDLQDCVPVQIRLLENIIKLVDSYTFSLNDGLIIDDLKSHVVSFVSDIERSGCKIINLQESYTCSSQIYELSERLIGILYPGEKTNSNSSLETEENRIEKLAGQFEMDTVVERHPTVELRSEMLQLVGERVCRLIDIDGYKPSDIVILSTYADTVTELVLAGILKDRGYNLCNISKRSRMSDSPLCRSILTFSQLCHPECRLFPSRDDLRIMCSILFKLDPVRSAMLARKIYNAIPFPEFPDDSWDQFEETLGKERRDGFIYIKQWVDNYIQTGVVLPVGEFINKVVIEIFLSAVHDTDEFVKARKLVDSSLRYSQSVLGFNRNATRDFIELARNQAIMPENTFETEYRISGEHVILSTPGLYLSSPISCKTAVICGLSSNNWLPGAAGELSNPYALQNWWKQDLTYTAEMDERNCRIQMAQMLGAVIKKCGEKIITFQSNLSANGFQNDGLLSEALDELLK